MRGEDIGSVTEIVEAGDSIYVGVENREPEGTAFVQIIKWDKPGGTYTVDAVGTSAKTVTCLLPVFEGRLLLCTHGSNTISIVETQALENGARPVKPSPFGSDAEDIEVFGVRCLEPDTLFDALATVVFNTSKGLFVCGIAADGHIDPADDNVFLSKHPITTANVISGNDVLVTYQNTIEVIPEQDMEANELR